MAIGATIGCDRMTKQIAETKLTGMPKQSFFGDTIRLEYVENAGAFWVSVQTGRRRFEQRSSESGMGCFFS